jgi:hypothetical protein
VNVKQIKSVAMNLVAVFGCAAGGALYNILQNGDLPHDWLGIRKLLTSAAFAGALAVFGWIKMRSPWAKPSYQFNLVQDPQVENPPAVKPI